MGRLPSNIHRALAIAMVAFSVVAVRPAFAEETPKSVRVITYNVQFLPAPVSFANKRKNPEYRAHTIGKAAAQFDIVALNETFDERYRDIIVGELRDAWGDDLNLLVSPKPEDRFNGGCLLATRLPVLRTHTYIYENISSPEEFGMRADGYAAKGVIHARIARAPGERDSAVDVFVTHLEARAPAIREKEYPELADFIRAHTDPDVPALLLGDLNTRGDLEYRQDAGSQYARMMGILNAARPAARFVDLWPLLQGAAHGGTTEQESTETGHRIDYMLLSNPPLPAPGLRPISIEVNMYQDPKVEALSDHSAVEAVIEWPASR